MTVTRCAGDAGVQAAGGPDAVCDIRTFDGIVCVSGDGLVNEVLQVR